MDFDWHGVSAAAQVLQIRMMLAPLLWQANSSSSVVYNLFGGGTCNPIFGQLGANSGADTILSDCRNET
jgi:hypothetical protein